MLERKSVFRSYLSDWKRTVLARPTILAKELRSVAQQKRWKANPLIKEVDEYLATEPASADKVRLRLWRKLKVIDCSVVERFWLRVEEEEFDYSGL